MGEFVCTNSENARNANAERQHRFRQTAKGQAAAAARNARAKKNRRDAKRQFQSERRAVVVNGVGAGDRVRDVGNNGAPGNAVRARFRAVGLARRLALRVATRGVRPWLTRPSSCQSRTPRSSSAESERERCAAGALKVFLTSAPDGAERSSSTRRTCGGMSRLKESVQ
jgi:hypothetical protein